MIRSADSPVNAYGTCAIAAAAAITGVSGDRLLAAARTRDSKTCVRHSPGCRLSVIQDALHAFGYETEEIFHAGMKTRIPLHQALTRTRGRAAIISIRGSRHAHSIAAEGFIVCDTWVRTPMWYGDWLDEYQTQRKLTAVIQHKRTVGAPPLVFSIIIVKEKRS